MINHRFLSIHEQIEHAILIDIFTGALLPNEKLNEKRLAERFGVSRGPVRSVIQKMTVEGVIYSKAHSSPVLSPKLEKSHFDFLMQLKYKIEENALKLVANMACDEVHANLISIYSQLYLLASREKHVEFILMDLEFHRTYIEQAGEELVSIWYSLYLRYWSNQAPIKHDIFSLQKHKAILQALGVTIPSQYQTISMTA